jgi:hypothetical protein
LQDLMASILNVGIRYRSRFRSSGSHGTTDHLSPPRRRRDQKTPKRTEAKLEGPEGPEGPEGSGREISRAPEISVISIFLAVPQSFHVPRPKRVPSS